MPIVRNEHKDNYTVINNSCMRDRNLSYKAKGLLAYMLSCIDGWEFTIESVASLSSDGTESVRTGLIELEKNGYLRRNVIRNNGHISDTEYIVYEVSQGEDFYSERTQK